MYRHTINAGTKIKTKLVDMRLYNIFMI